MVGRHVRRANDAVDRGEINDAATARALQVRDGVLDTEEHALDIDRLDRVPLGFRDFVCGLVVPGDPGVIDQYIQTSEMCRGGVSGAVHVGLAAYVDMPVARQKTTPNEFGGQRFAFAVKHIEHRNRRPLFGHADRAGTPRPIPTAPPVTIATLPLSLAMPIFPLFTESRPDAFSWRSY